MTSSVIEMTSPYDARWSFYPLRPKFTIILLTQSALGQIWLENGLYQVGDFFLSSFETVPCKKLSEFPLAWAKKKYIPKSRSPNVADFHF